MTANVTSFSAYLVTELTCGNSVCESTYGETVSTCSLDCAAASSPGSDNTGGGGGGGGGSIIFIPANETNKTNATVIINGEEGLFLIQSLP